MAGHGGDTRSPDGAIQTRLRADEARMAVLGDVRRAVYAGGQRYAALDRRSTRADALAGIVAGFGALFIAGYYAPGERGKEDA